MNYSCISSLDPETSVKVICQKIVSIPSYFINAFLL